VSATENITISNTKNQNHTSIQVKILNSTGILYFCDQRFLIPKSIQITLKNNIMGSDFRFEITPGSSTLEKFRSNFPVLFALLKR